MAVTLLPKFMLPTTLQQNCNNVYGADEVIQRLQHRRNTPRGFATATEVHAAHYTAPNRNYTVCTEQMKFTMFTALQKNTPVKRLHCYLEVHAPLHRNRTAHVYGADEVYKMFATSQKGTIRLHRYGNHVPLHYTANRIAIQCIRELR